MELGAVDLPMSAILQMSEGDTLLLDSRPERMLPMMIDGEPRFLCRAGMVGNQIGIRVHEVVETQMLDLSEFDDHEAALSADDAVTDDDHRVIEFPTPTAEAETPSPDAIDGDVTDASPAAPIEEAASA